MLKICFMHQKVQISNEITSGVLNKLKDMWKLFNYQNEQYRHILKPL